MRIYGITYDHTTNYGSCFQAYALQHAIEQIRTGEESWSYSLIPIKTLREWTKSLKTYLIKPLHDLQRRKFTRFEKENMKFAPVRSIRELPGLNADADAFVCGSDVIWNSAFNHSFDAFYLDFARKYTFSYAASFGKDAVNEREKACIRKNLPRFDDVSCREQSGVETIRKEIGREASLVADPVLLLSRGDWEKFCKAPVRDGKYIFVYATHLNGTIREAIDRLKKQTGLEVVYSACGPKQALRLGMIQVQGPEEWLSLLCHAEYVITNSYHATAFSTLFHKKFFTVVEGEKDKGINIRMYDFLQTMGLGDRIINTVSGEFDLKEPDFGEADRRIAERKEESVAYLRRNLEAAYQQKLAAGRGANG